ncbi:MAG TPA: hypothetical protein V6D30_16845 [Leptolyngbyaceae cyanobacterium]
MTKERQKAEGTGQKVNLLPKAQAFWRPKGRSASDQPKVEPEQGYQAPLNESSVACIRGGV